MRTLHLTTPPAGRSRESWRARWRRRNDPALVRAIFWSGFFHTLGAVRGTLTMVMVIMIVAVFL